MILVLLKKPCSGNETYCECFQLNQIDEDEADDEEMGVAETYADYWPSKREFKLKY